MTSHQLETIKRDIGASYVSYYQRKSEFGLKVVKGGVEDRFSLNGTPQDVDSIKYQALREDLIEYYNAKT